MDWLNISARGSNITDLASFKSLTGLDSLTHRIGKYRLNRYLSESNKISYI